MIHDKPSFSIVLSYFDVVMKCGYTDDRVDVMIVLFLPYYEGTREGEVSFARRLAGGVQLVCYSLRANFCTIPQRAVFY